MARNKRVSWHRNWKTPKKENNNETKTRSVPGILETFIKYTKIRNRSEVR